MRRAALAASIVAALSLSVLVPGAPAAQAQSGTRWPLVTTAYDGVIYELVNWRDEVRITPARWREHYGSATPATANTRYIKYPWSTTIYAQTIWYVDENRTNRSTAVLSAAQWRRAGSPAPQTVGFVQGSSVMRWETNRSELFLHAPDKTLHKLTPAQWAATGYEPFHMSPGGYVSLSWAPRDIAYLSDLDGMGPVLLTQAEWVKLGSPTPLRMPRIGRSDTFGQFRGDPTIHYVNSWMQRPITYAEWRAAGSPVPEQYGAVAR